MGILALFFVLVSLAAFKMLTKETTFEDVYGENAMRLFAEEKTGKQKTTKSTKSKAKNADKKKDHAQEKEKKRTSDSELQTKTVERKSEEPQQIVLEHAKPEKMADAKNVKQPDEENVKIVDEMPVLQQEMPKHTKKKNKNKQHQEAEETKAVERNTPPPSHEKQNVVDEPEVAVKVEVKATQQSQKKSASPAVAEVAGTEETSSASAEGVEKKAKKKRARRAEEQLHEVGTKEEMQPLMSTEPIKEQKQQVLAAKEEKKPEKEKPKPKKPAISVRDITVDKLHTRLSAVDDLEPEYLSFLAAYFSDTGALKTKLTDENATLRREVADKTKLAHQVVSDAQKKDSEIAHLK
ncbi:unnamed protein product [Anisakis simplex]|uniref:Kinectin n=1 Tax=Anisakis simplex TaxID=6269 RepID=A0A0M3KAB6_ANISI|nr:unnamed protein product [Anisakis simplex]